MKIIHSYFVIITVTYLFSVATCKAMHSGDGMFPFAGVSHLAIEASALGASSVSSQTSSFDLRLAVSESLIDQQNIFHQFNTILRTHNTDCERLPIVVTREPVSVDTIEQHMVNHAAVRGQDRRGRVFIVARVMLSRSRRDSHHVLALYQERANGTDWVVDVPSCLKALFTHESYQEMA